MPLENEIVEALRKIAVAHKKDPYIKNGLLYFAWYRRERKRDVFILEIVRGASDPRDASWNTFTFCPPSDLKALRGRNLKITYMSPEEFFLATAKPKSHGYKVLMEIQRDGTTEIFCARSKSAKKIQVALRPEYNR